MNPPVILGLAVLVGLLTGCASYEEMRDAEKARLEHGRKNAVLVDKGEVRRGK